MGEHGDVEGLGSDSRSGRNRRVRVLQELERPREADEHHERAHPVVRSPRPRDQAGDGEGDEDQGGERGESGPGLVVARRAGATAGGRRRRRSPARARGEASACPDYPLPAGAGEAGRPHLGGVWLARIRRTPPVRDSAGRDPARPSGRTRSRVVRRRREQIWPCRRLHTERARFVERNEPALKANNR